MINIGDEVKILNTSGFNDRFVKVGDIAKVTEITNWAIEIKSDDWEYSQFTCDYLKGIEWEIVTPEKVRGERG